MSITNEFSSILYDDQVIPLDIRYTDFLNALSEINDETKRNQCHKYWTTLYRYYDHSLTNEQALIIEEKRTQEILHHLNLEISSHQSNIAYQVQNILEHGYQILSDIHIKYNQKKDSLTEIKQNINHLENQIQKQKSHYSLTTDFNTISSSISLTSIIEIIDNLKLDINNLYNTRENLQIQLNNQQGIYFSRQIQIYHIQQIISKTEKEFLKIEYELKKNLKENSELNKQFDQYQKNLSSFSFNQDNSNFNQQLINKQINNEENLFIQLKNQNKELNINYLDQITFLKIYQNKQKQLNLNSKDLIKKIYFKQEYIEKEKENKQKFSKILLELNKKLKIKENFLFILYQQEKIFQKNILQLENQRNKYEKNLNIIPLENINKFIENLNKNIYKEINHRLKLTLIYYNYKQDIKIYKNIIEKYFFIVKNQREKIINYEKLHDKWILNININKKRLLKLFNRINKIQQFNNQTNNFLQQFNQIKLLLRPNILILYNNINLFIQQRREKNDINIIDESKNSLNIKLNKMKENIRSNQLIYNQIEKNIFILKKNSSILFNQIIIINKYYFYLKKYLNYIKNKFNIKKQEILNILNKFNLIKYLINLNNKKYEKFKIEKEKICILLLNKQYFILLINKYFKINEKYFFKQQLSIKQIKKKIYQIRLQILIKFKQINLFNQNKFYLNIKQNIINFQKQLFEYKKKNKNYQYEINRRHLTQQILTKFNNKSIIKENNKQYQINLQEKFSSIIYRLICKTYYNIILYKYFNIIMEKIFLLYLIDRKLLKKSFNFNYLNNQLKLSIAELNLFKNQILISKKIYINMKYTLEKLSSISDIKKKEKTKTLFNY